ncbi:GNAT family N-acetyltransferase [Rhizocola hellebori]|uniref:GNAT family N-acetyltransferase n=1 Tax=Rhizocola hellebori TaxID=1392758 RepID=UPI0019419F7D|nr:GNAT family N-acetyltransferase [Rhizocola hellebori]
MSELRIEPVNGDQMILDWQHVHNAIIPNDPLSLADIGERLRRNRLEVAYLAETLVGCTTVRPPSGDTAAATVIVRVLAEHRRRGLGSQLYVRALAQARALGTDEIETIVWASNVDGLRFAEALGFVEVSRYLPPDEEVPYLTLRLTDRG